MYRKKPAQFTATEINQHLNGKLIGKESEIVTGISPFEAPETGTITFCTEYREERVKEKLASNPFSILITKEDSKPGDLKNKITLILVKDPYQAVISLISLFYEKITFDHTIDPSSKIDPSCKIDQEVHIGPFCYIGPNVTIGKGSVLHSNVTLYEGVSVGENCLLHSGATLREFVQIGSNSIIQNGAVIGADGFGYVPDPKIGLMPVPQVGTVVLEDRVDLGAQACIDRATLGFTHVKAGTKLDNMVQVGHNCQIGSNSLLCALTGVGGSARIGNQVVLGGKSGVADHLKIVDGVRVGGAAGVVTNLLEKSDYMGYPAVKASEWRRQSIALKKLPALLKKVRKLIP